MARRAKHQPECCELDCTEPAQVDWKDDPRNSDTWFYTECTHCESYYCERCADQLLEYDPETDTRSCIDCTATRMRQEAKKTQDPGGPVDTVG